MIDTCFPVLRPIVRWSEDTCPHPHPPHREWPITPRGEGVCVADAEEFLVCDKLGMKQNKRQKSAQRLAPPPPCDATTLQREDESALLQQPPSLPSSFLHPAYHQGHTGRGIKELVEECGLVKEGGGVKSALK